MSSSPIPDSVPPGLPSPRPARPAPAADRSVRWGLAIALLVAVAAIALAWDARQSFSSLSQSSGGRLAELGNEVAQSKAALAQAQAALKDSQARLAEVESRLSDAQESRVAVEDMYRELARSTDDRMLAEVEQLLILASQQLQLAGNVKGALIALEAADQRLSRADKLQAANLRRALNQDMERLKALPLVDTVGLAVKLDGLVQQADTLPLVVSETLPPARSPSRAKAPEESGWLRALRDFWEEMKGLVRIRELETQETALVSPAQAYFLRQNLKLRLLAARVALLARDETSYRDDVKAAQAWIARYFDAKARATVVAQGTLKQLADSHVSIVVPDINTSLSAVRAARSAREKQR